MLNHLCVTLYHIVWLDKEHCTNFFPRILFFKNESKKLFFKFLSKIRELSDSDKVFVLINEFIFY